MRIRDWSSDVCSSDLVTATRGLRQNVDQEDGRQLAHHLVRRDVGAGGKAAARRALGVPVGEEGAPQRRQRCFLLLQQAPVGAACRAVAPAARSEEHTSELQSLMRISYADFSSEKHTSQPTV